MPFPSNRNNKSLHIVELNARLDEVSAREKNSTWFTKSKCAKLALSLSFCWFSFGICALYICTLVYVCISVQAFAVASQAWMIYKLSSCRAIALEPSNYSMRPPKCETDGKRREKTINSKHKCFKLHGLGADMFYNEMCHHFIRTTSKSPAGCFAQHAYAVRKHNGPFSIPHSSVLTPGAPPPARWKETPKNRWKRESPNVGSSRHIHFSKSPRKINSNLFQLLIQNLRIINQFST